ncbi:MAG: hypothetical protein JWO48_1671, partial [Bryobacterales bacterium]|nr:hypothetical protein [Bryobacterales bacterium]
MAADIDATARPIEQDQQWQAIASAAATVVLLAQRDSGLWSYATCPGEVGAVYAPAGSIEHRSKSTQTFGSESLTVTCLALMALTESFGTFPPDILPSVLQQLEGHRDPVQPVYGTLLGGRHPGRINKSATHTAMVLLTLLSNQETVQFKILQQIASWILNARLPNGGWSYEESEKSSAEPISTAACLCALSCFLARFPHIAKDKLAEDIPYIAKDKLAEDIPSALAAGFDALLKLQLKSALWPGYNVGETDIVDSCFVIDLLSLELARGPLQLVPNFSVEMENLKRVLKQHCSDAGWPDAWGPSIATNQPSLGATISALYVLDGFEPNDVAWQHRYAAVQELLVSQLSAPNGGGRLTSWDWIMLCRLASLRCKMRQKTAHEIFQAVQRFQELRQARKIEKSLPNIPTIARTAIIFLISRGQFTQVPRALIMKGGGVKGLAFAGAIQELERNYKFDT